jgi:hypothetical protein
VSLEYCFVWVCDNNPAADDVTMLKDYAKCEKEGDAASLTIIGAFIPIGLGAAGISKNTTTRDLCMKNLGYAK